MLRVRELAGVTAIAMCAMAGAIVWQSVQPPRPVAAAVRKLTPVIIAAPVQRIAVEQPLKRAVVALRALEKIAAPPEAGDEPANSNTIRAAETIVPDAELAAQAPDVATRLRDRVPSGLMRYFDVVLYVSKSAQGPWAQHMFVFHRDDNDALVYEQNFPVSTGREQYEKYFTSTPAGIFELDPNRFETMHYSHTWHGAPMAWAMFLNYIHNDRLVGVALHSAGEHVPDLGHRASGGCVRLPPEMAAMLFHRFESEERGEVPMLQFDESRRSTSVAGDMMRDADGRPVMTDGYKVLLVIEDYPGGPALVAVLS
jgi:lipoprotein-anchoring transpeptidase ErfK/SrfK